MFFNLIRLIIILFISIYSNANADQLNQNMLIGEYHWIHNTLPDGWEDKVDNDEEYAKILIDFASIVCEPKDGLIWCKAEAFRKADNYLGMHFADIEGFVTATENANADYEINQIFDEETQCLLYIKQIDQNTIRLTEDDDIAFHCGGVGAGFEGEYKKVDSECINK